MENEDERVNDKDLKDRVLKTAKWYEDFSNSQKPLIERTKKSIEFRKNLKKVN